jgi:SAM-dependent methyltransferase
MGVKIISHVGVLVKESEVSLIQNYYPDGKYPMKDISSILILELFLKPRTIEEAYEIYTEYSHANDAKRSDRLQQIVLSNSRFLALVMNESLYVTASSDTIDDAQFTMKTSLHHAFMFMKNEHEAIVDATDDSSLTSDVLMFLVTQMNKDNAYKKVGYAFEQFKTIVDEFCWLGFLGPEKGAIDFGSLRRIAAICPDFGWSRGTPIDRYYLNNFITTIRHEVRGDVMEVGGVNTNRETYDFVNATSYLAVDLKMYRNVDIVADVNDANAFLESCFDSIVAFNVLEHCEFPYKIVSNFLRWLRPGGKIFCMVPSTQRYHPAPRDYWRPMPDAMWSLFKEFDVDRFVVYGNALTAIASLMGTAFEELTQEDLDASNPYFPVAICLVARRR